MRTFGIIAGVCLVVGVGLFYFVGSDRTEVAKKKVLDRLDGVLGKMDVQRQEIDTGIKSTAQAVDGIRKAKIKAQVKLEQIDDRTKPYQEKIAQCDQTLSKLRDLLAANQPADIAGKTYSVNDQKDMANKIIQARKDAENQIKGFKTARDNMQQVVATLGKQQQALEHRLTSLQSQLTKLDTELMAARAMKEASAAMGDKDTTLAANLDNLESKIASLAADVRVELQGETDKWSEVNTNRTINEVDAFIQASQQPTDTVFEIDRILGKK